MKGGGNLVKQDGQRRLGGGHKAAGAPQPHPGLMETSISAACCIQARPVAP